MCLIYSEVFNSPYYQYQGSDCSKRGLKAELSWVQGHGCAGPMHDGRLRIWCENRVSQSCLTQCLEATQHSALLFHVSLYTRKIGKKDYQVSNPRQWPTTMKRMKLLCAWSLLCDAVSQSRLWWSVFVCTSKAFPGLIFLLFAIHGMICCCEPLGPIVCWISEHREGVLARALGGFCHLHRLSCWEEQDTMGRYLLGNRIWSKCFCNVIFVSWYTCKIWNQLSLVQFFN